MKEKIENAVRESTSLDDVKDALLEVFEELRKSGYKQIGYVSGPVTSDGPENIPNNIKILKEYTEKVRSEHKFPIFSATDVFDEALFARLDAAGYKNEDWITFWREVLESEKRFVTDIFMIPRWQKSRGATDEHDIAGKMNMTINYIEYEV